MLDYKQCNKWIPQFFQKEQPKGTYKDGSGEVNFPLSFGGVLVNPGNIIVGDKDGVIVIPQSFSGEIYQETITVSTK